MLSEMTKDIGMSMVLMDTFFDERYARQKGSTYAIDMTSESWLLVTDSEGMPIGFRMLPGSVADITTLKAVVDALKEKGLSGDALFGRGSESAANVKYLLDGGIGFVTPSNIDSKALKAVLTDSSRTTWTAKGSGHLMPTGPEAGSLSYSSL